MNYKSYRPHSPRPRRDGAIPKVQRFRRPRALPNPRKRLKREPAPPWVVWVYLFGSGVVMLMIWAAFEV
jgi:hypothetical protein